jgi:hypothetical protein
MQSLCGAHCRTTGMPCQNYPMENGRCRMHGGGGGGRPITHGQYTKEAVTRRAELVGLNRELRQLLRSIKS